MVSRGVVTRSPLIAAVTTVCIGTIAFQIYQRSTSLAVALHVGPSNFACRNLTTGSLENRSSNFACRNCTTGSLENRSFKFACRNPTTGSMENCPTTPYFDYADKNVKLLFVRSPKTGSTSLRVAFREKARALKKTVYNMKQCSKSTRKFCITDVNPMCTVTNHDLMIEHILPKEELYRYYVPQPTFNITAVRSPLSRAVSFYLQIHYNLTRMERNTTKCASAQSYLRRTIPLFLKEYDSAAGDPLVIDQYSYLSMGDQSVLGSTVEEEKVLDKFDFVFVSELLSDASAECLARYLKLGEQPIRIKHENRRSSTCVDDAFGEVIRSNFSSLSSVFRKDEMLYASAVSRYNKQCMMFADPRS